MKSSKTFNSHQQSYQQFRVRVPRDSSAERRPEYQ
jgi:hypothetical protein